MHFFQGKLKLGLGVTLLAVLMLSPTGLMASEPALGAVATQHPLASQAAAKILRKGGNAMDAAVAAALTLAVVEPYNSGLGAGGMALVWDAKEKKASAIDFRETAPGLATETMYLQPGLSPMASQEGPLAVAVPGEVAGLETLHKKWGRLPWRELFQDPVRYAEAGFVGSETLKSRVLDRWACLSRDYQTYKIYRPLFEGEGFTPFIQKDLAESLKKIRDQGATVFYQGEMADILAKNLRGKGGLLSLSDLKNFQAVERAVLVSHFPWGKVWGVPLPSSGGISVLRALNTLTALQNRSKANPQWIPWLMATFGQIFQTRNHEMGDSDFVPKLPVKKWISKGYARKKAKEILKMSSVAPLSNPKEKNISSFAPLRGATEDTFSLAPQSGAKEKVHTTHLSVIDADGNAAALTLSLNLSFGSCVTAGETGILMNNQMDDFSTRPSHANAFGLVQSQANAIAPGKRPLSSISPTLVTKKKQVILAIGSPGGPRIITSLIQVLFRYFILNESLAKSVVHARIHYQDLPKKIYIEEKLPENLREELKRLNLPLSEWKAWSNVQAVAYDPLTKTFAAQSDPRGRGKALVVFARP